MRPILVAFAIALIAGCGADSMNAAATAAAIKQQELEQAKKTKAQLEQRIGVATEQMQESARRAGEPIDTD